MPFKRIIYFVIILEVNIVLYFLYDIVKIILDHLNILMFLAIIIRSSEPVLFNFSYVVILVC